MKKLLFGLLLGAMTVFATPKLNYINNTTTYKQLVGDSKNAVIIYGAAWCPACQKFLKELKQYDNHLAKTNTKVILVEFPYIPMEKQLENYENETISYINQLNVGYDVYLDNELSILNTYKIDKVPAITMIHDNKEISLFENVKIDKILNTFK